MGTRQHLIATLLIAALAACDVSIKATAAPVVYRSPASVSATDLVGTWQAEYAAGRAIDTVVIRADGTYRQVYADTSGYTYEGLWQEWRVETRPGGCVYLHMECMRYFVAGVEKANDITKGMAARLLEPCEDRIIETGGELVLTVVSSPLPPGSIRLMQLKPDADTSDSFFLRVSGSGTDLPEEKATATVSPTAEP